jgi:hypothetical protein
MTTRERVEAYFNDGLTRERIREKLLEQGVAIKTIQNALSVVAPKRALKRNPEIPGAQTLDEFGSPYDYPQKVLEALEVLRNSSKSVCPDVPFRKFCGISEDKWKTLKGVKKLKTFHRKMPNGQILWGDPNELLQAEKRARHIYE